MPTNPSIDCVGEASFWSPRHVIDSAWLGHAPFAFWLTSVSRPRIIVELGTYAGFSYLSFCQTVQQLGLSTACYGVDTWKGDEHGGFYGEHVYTQLAALHDKHYAGFSRLLRCRFEDALQHFSDGSVDLLHIDGRHRYEDAVTDFESWRPKLSSKAVVLFHDTNVREKDFGVWRLWSEISGQYPSFEFLHGHGLGVLAVGSEVPDGLRPLFAGAAADVRLIRTIYERLGRTVQLQCLLDEARRTIDASSERMRARRSITQKIAGLFSKRTDHG